MASENSWGPGRAADAEYGGDVFAPTPEQKDMADKILKGSELEGLTIEGEEDASTSTDHTPKNW